MLKTTLHLLTFCFAQTPKRAANDTRVRGRPHLRKRAHDEGSVAFCHHPRVEDRDDAAVGRRAQETPCSLGHHEGGVGEGHGHETVAAAALHVH